MTAAPRATTRVFLFTDIEGSTKRWDSDRAAMSAALARHDALLRAAIESAGGAVFKTVGDAFCAVFDAAGDGVAAAQAAQRLLSNEDWSVFGTDFAPLRVRMALHAGEAEARDGDWFGPPLNRVARLLAAGHGGQVLLSDAARALLIGALPAGVALRDLGERRLRDLRAPERVWQITAPDLPADFPPLATLDARPNNLPGQLTGLIGREAEVAAITGLLRAADGPRLVTLTGPGGTGKTRLGLQAAAELIDDFDHGVWLVELAPLADPDLVISTVAGVLGVREPPGGSPLAALADHLADRRLLLLLDNCEHVVDRAARLAEALLRAAPGLAVLATSREPVRLPGEAVVPVAALAVPARGVTSAAALARFDAVRLFIERALAVKPDFVVTDANAAAVAEICHRLDGLPLAIELAAARTRVLAVEDIAARLDQGFRLLTGGGRTALPRQQTLRGAIDWSYDLLPTLERRVLERLAVFAGRCRLEAAEAVCAGTEVGRDEVLDAVDSLAAKSLVVADTAGGVSRFWLLETIRQYALEKLQARGDEVAARDRHLAWHIGLVSMMEQETRGPNPLAWRRRLKRQHDNLRAALNWGLADPSRTPAVLSLAVPLARFWPQAVMADMREGHRWLERVRQAALDAHLDEVDPEAVAWVVLGAGALIGNYDTGLGEMRTVEALGLFHRCGVAVGEADALGRLGYLALNRGDLPGAESMLEQSLALMRTGGQDADIVGILNGLAEAARLRGDYDRAADLFVEVVARAAGSDLSQIMALYHPLHNLGHVELRRGNVREAEARFKACLDLDIRGDGNLVALCLAGLGGVAAAASQAKRAALLFGAADTVLGAQGYALDRTDQLDWDRNVALARAQLDGAAWDAAWAEGAAMTLDAAAAYALESDEPA